MDAFEAWWGRSKDDLSSAKDAAQAAWDAAVAVERERCATIVVRTGYRLKGAADFGAGVVAIEAARLIREGKE